MLNGLTIPVKQTVKYHGVHLDRRVTWKPNIGLKLKPKKCTGSIPRKYNKNILKPVWTYVVQLWGTACDSNIHILQKYQSLTLRTITVAP